MPTLHTWAYVGEWIGICLRNLPQGGGTYSVLSQMAYTFSFDVFGKLFMSSINTFAWQGIRRGMVRRFVPQVWRLAPLGYFNSPLTLHQAPGTVGRGHTTDRHIIRNGNTRQSTSRESTWQETSWGLVKNWLELMLPSLLTLWQCQWPLVSPRAHTRSTLANVSLSPMTPFIHLLSPPCTERDDP